MKSLYLKISLPVLFLLTAMIISGTVSAQSAQERKADQLYDDFAYSKAVEVYELLHKEDASNSKYIQRLAYSYDKMLAYKKALVYYALLVKTDINKPEDFYEYAQLLRIDGNFTDSKTWLEKYMVSFPGDQRAKSQLENINQLLKLKSDSEKITFKNLSGNTRFTDMCPTFYKDGFIYSSAKDSFSMVRNNFDWSNQPFLDLYVTEPGATDNTPEDKVFSKELNSRFHEGPVCFTSDFNTIYFTRNSFINGKVGRTPQGVNNLKIFIAEYDGKEWKSIRGLRFNSDQYSVGHPALSPDNKTLYFVSDMPGGLGETDIYKSEWENGTWGKPLNLGATINTKGKEMFPSVDKDGILYFASNGLPGLGGLDIFAAKADANGNYMVVNLGEPLNSQYDDFGYVVNMETLSGYFSSNRPGGKGADDNYAFAVNEIDLKVLSFDDHSRLILPGAKIELRGEDGKVLDSQVADMNGVANFTVKPGSKYQLVAENASYVPETKDIKIQGTMFNFEQEDSIFMKQSYPYLTIEIIDKETGLIIPNALLDISEGKYDEDELEDNNGIIKMKLNAATDYTFYATSEEYFDKTVKYSSKDKTPGEYSMTIELEKLSTGKQFTLDDLYYDYNKYNIRPDAALVLDKLVKILADNPEIRIEIGSHTDSRGAADYNLKLSQNRSESVVDYLVSKGITRNRLEAKGYGEAQLINKCADGVDCTEAEHQVNRRTVIEILNTNIRRVKRGSKNVYYF
ncbi:MAG: OmpA family protein [Prolixibacteraceae bacterium]|jgi:outer membrane protein OmpA-like peptidoglycan-associated protein